MSEQNPEKIMRSINKLIILNKVVDERKFLKPNLNDRQHFFNNLIKKEQFKIM